MYGRENRIMQRIAVVCYLEVSNLSKVQQRLMRRFKISTNRKKVQTRGESTQLIQRVRCS